MSRRNIKVQNLNDDYQYYSARLIDLNDVLSDTNRELNGIDAEIDINNNKRRTNQKRKDKRHIKNTRVNNHYSPEQFNYMPRDFDIRSSLSDNEEEYYEKSRYSTNCHSANKKYKTSAMKQNLNDSLHDLHKKVRDISFEQEKLADQMNSEKVLYCNCESTCCARKSGGSNSCTKKKASSSEMDTSFENRLENRLQQVYSKIKRKYEAKSVNEELKTVLEDFKKSTGLKEDTTNKVNLNPQLIENDLEKQKAQTELLLTKQRIADLEDSKNTLTKQVKALKDQLEKFETNQFTVSHNERVQPTHYQHQSHQQQIPIPIQLPQQQMQMQVPYNLMDTLKSGQTNEVVQALDKYKKEIDQLNENIQNYKMTLKDKELEEKEQKHEMKSLKEKYNDLDKENQILKSDLEIALQKLNEVAYESNQNANQVQVFQEQFNLSEKKREELKQDAQETIKLWKNKVKKLEKSLERTRIEYENISQQNEFLKENSKNLTTQLENLNQEFYMLREINKNLETRLNTQGNEINHTKNTFDELKNENNSLKTELTESQNSLKVLESRNSDLQSIKSNLEQKLKAEESKSNDLYQRLCQFQNELEELRSDKKESSNYISKLESECQNLKNTLNSMERSEEEAKNDMINVSKQAIQNKENYEECISKYTNQLQMAQCQIQKLKMEGEDRFRSLQVQLVEEKSSNEILRKREMDYLNEIDELKITKQRIEDDLMSIQTRLEKFVRSDNEKSRVISEYEDKYGRVLDELNYQKNHHFNKETDYIKVLNLIEVDVDLLIGVLATNLNKTYQPLLNLDESDKTNLLYLIIKHKTHWIAKSLEELLQLKIKLQQNIVFMEHEIEAMKKNTAYNIKAQGLFLKNLENQNNELLADRAIALKNLELLEQYLHNLSESVKNHSLKEIERTHHLFAIDNFMSLCNNHTLSDAEKDEIHERFRTYKNTIDEIKSQLDMTQLNCSSMNANTQSHNSNSHSHNTNSNSHQNDRSSRDKDVRISSSCSSIRSTSQTNSNSTNGTSNSNQAPYSHYPCKKFANTTKKPQLKPKPFR